MEFEDLGEAKALLARISYFRLKYFWTDLIDDSTDGDFLPDTSFDMVMKRYNFDHNLRLVLFDADGLDYVCRDVWAGGYHNFSC